MIRLIIKFKNAGFNLDEIKILFIYDDKIVNPKSLTKDDLKVLNDILSLTSNKIQVLNNKVDEINFNLKILKKMNEKLKNSIKKGELLKYENT